MKRILLTLLFLLAVIVPLTVVLAQNAEVKKAVINSLKCTGCGDCVSSCPTKAITLVNQKAVIDTDKCVNCLLCVKTCSYKAIAGSQELK